jgi:hypothetical protein
MVMRTVKEIRQIANEMEGEDVNIMQNLLLAPGNLSAKQVRFILAAMEDDLEDEDKRELFAACVGKTDEEIVELAYKATTPAEASEEA